ncbi:MAG: anti-sigma factor [Vicinamibacterales bacterium]
MNCTHYRSLLNACADGALPPTGDLAAHLATCTGCARLLRDLRAIRVAARGLGPVTPPPEIWERLAGQLGSGRRDVSASSAWRDLTPAFRAIAAGMVLALGLSVAWLGSHLEPALPPEPVGETALDEAGLGDAERQVAQALDGLQALAAGEPALLDPDTTSVLRDGLATIDAAIDESRSALAGAPGNEPAQASLLEALRSKVTLLQDTVSLINRMRQGDQEGSARLATEMNP